MSTFSSSNPNKHSLHWRNNSGELDVFEAAKYFSSAHDHLSDYMNNSHYSPKPARRSIDVPTRLPIILDHQKPIKDKKKYKQPSSPGGRLASFLNSLFNTPLKNKKSKSSSSTLEQESPGGRRKRRLSISHFRITTTDPKSLSSTSNTPIKSYDGFRKFSEAKNSKNMKPTLLDELCAEKGACNGAPDKIFGFPGRKSDAVRVGGYPLEERVFRKFSDVDDGGDSDSSSDLFDLPNHDLDFYSSSLPVYETTRMDRIKIVAPMSNATKVN